MLMKGNNSLFVETDDFDGFTDSFKYAFELSSFDGCFISLIRCAVNKTSIVNRTTNGNETGMFSMFNTAYQCIQ